MKVPDETLLAEWRALAPAWIKQSREGRNANRTGLIDPVMLNACGDVRGKRVLDCGCGEGRFVRMMVQRGAGYVLGIDLCPPMIDAARELQSGMDEYRVANAEDLSFLADRTFDLAISYLNHCDLEDWLANTREVFRILKPGGHFLIANLHPMRSASGYWHKDSAGNKLHCILDKYMSEGPRRWRMLACDFTNFHRTLETYIRGFRRAGFLVDQILEPTVTPEQVATWPELDDELRVPNFIVYVLLKPN